MNQSTAKFYSVKEAPGIYKSLYGDDINFYDFIKHVDHIIRQSGMMKKMFIFKGTVADYELELPCGVDHILYVGNSQPIGWWCSFYGFSDTSWLINYRVDQSGNLGLNNPEATDHDLITIETSQVYEINRNVFYGPQGSLVDFQNDNNCCLKFNWKDKNIDVLYLGKVLDEDGYPKLTDRALLALVKYVHYVKINRRYFAQQADANMRAIAKQEYDIAVAQARSPESFNVNEIDETLNVMNSFNRKLYNSQLRQF